MARLINAEVLAFFATPPSVTALVAEWLQAPQGEKLWRLLDPCCGEGRAAAHLATTLGGPVNTWGVELSPKRAERAATVLDKVHNTAWQATRVSKESVSLLWLNPPYDTDLDGDSKRLEIEFLRTALPTLVHGGVLVYIVPQHLLGYRDVARLLSGHFENISVRRFPDGEYERFKQVVVLARRKPYSTPTEESLDVLRALRDADGLRADRRSAAIERVHRGREALAYFANAIGIGHAHTVESDYASWRTAQTDLVLELVDLHSPLGFYQEGGDAAVAIGGCASKDGV